MNRYIRRGSDNKEVRKSKFRMVCVSLCNINAILYSRPQDLNFQKKKKERKK